MAAFSRALPTIVALCALAGAVWPVSARAGDEGLIRRWLVAGPFPHEKPYTWLTEPMLGDPARLAPSPGDPAGEGKWVEASSPSGTIDLKAVGIAAPANCGAAAMVYAKVPKMTPAKLVMGFAEGLVVYVNGRRAYEYPRSKRMARDEFRTDVLLGAGWNRLYMQVPRHENPRREWGFAVRLVGADLKEIAGLELATKNPAGAGKVPEARYQPFVSAYSVEHFGTRRIRIVNRTPIDLPGATLTVRAKSGRKLQTSPLGTLKGHAYAEAEVTADEVSFQRQYAGATAEVAYEGGKLTAPIAPLALGGTHRIEYVTPHINRMRPWAAGRPVVLIVAPKNTRQAMELVQRGDLEWHLVSLDEPNAANLLAEELALYKFDCIVVPAQRWKRIPHAEALLAAVKAGAGLVVVNPTEMSEAGWSAVGLEPVAGRLGGARGGELVRVGDHDHVAISGVPLAALPPIAPQAYKFTKDAEVLAKIGDQPVVALKKTGDGRVVMLNLGRGAELIWPIRGVTDLRLPVWERQWSLLLKAIVWAAKKETSVTALSPAPQRLSRDELGKKQLWFEFHMIGRDHRDVWFELTHRVEGVPSTEKSRFYPKRPWDARVGGGSSISIPLLVQGRLDAGENEVDVVVKDKGGKVLGWATAVFHVQPRGSIGPIALAPEKVYYLPEDKLTFTVPGKAEADGLTLIGSLADNKGRVVLEQRRRVKKGQFSETFTFKPRGLLTTVGRFCVELAAARNTEARAEKVFFVRHKFVWDSYEPVIWLTRGSVRWHYDVEYFRMLWNAMWVPNGWSGNFGDRSTAYNQMVHGGLASVGQESLHFFSMNHNWTQATFERRRNNFRKSKYNTRWLYRTPIDPKTKMPVEKPDYENLKFNNNPHNSFFPLDDPEYLAWTRRKIAHQLKDHVRYNPVTYDLMDEGSYTSYARAFDFDHSPVSLKHFRLWLKTEYADLAALNAEWETNFQSWDDVTPMHCRQAQQRAAEATKAGKLPNYAPWVDHRRYGDIVYNKYIRLCSDAARAIDDDACVGIGGGQHANPYGGWDYWLVTNHFTWIENYFRITTEYIRSFNTPDRRLKACPGDDVWFSIMHGNCGFYRWVDMGHCRSDFSLLPRGEVTARQLAEVRGRGFAKLFLRAEPVDDPVGIHYSQASILVAHGAGEMSRANQYGYGGPLDAKKGFYHLLEELGYQFKFVAYAQLEAGELETGRWRILILPESTALSDAEADALKRFVAAGGVLLCDRGTGRWNHHGRRRAKTVLETRFGIDPSAPADQPIGKGRVIYLNSDFPVQYWNDRSDKPVEPYWSKLQGALTQAGVTRPRARMHAAGGPARKTEIRYFRLGKIAYHAAGAEVPGRYEFRVAEPGHLYDMREGRYGGIGNRIQVAASGSFPALVAVSPYKVEAVRAAADRAAVERGEAVRIAAKVEASAAPGVHALNFRVYSPDGEERRCYGDTLFGEGGAAALTIPTALNDATGRWTVKVADLASGVAGEAAFEVK